jgi:hypothetical protein
VTVLTVLQTDRVPHHGAVHAVAWWITAPPYKVIGTRGLAGRWCTFPHQFFAREFTAAHARRKVKVDVSVPFGWRPGWQRNLNIIVLMQ